jgi:hypothetical protein
MKRYCVEWTTPDGRTYRRAVKAESEVAAYRKTFEEALVSYEKMLLKYAPDWREKRKRAIHEAAEKAIGQRHR